MPRRSSLAFPLLLTSAFVGSFLLLTLQTIRPGFLAQIDNAKQACVDENGNEYFGESCDSNNVIDGNLPASEDRSEAPPPPMGCFIVKKILKDDQGRELPQMDDPTFTFPPFRFHLTLRGEDVAVADSDHNGFATFGPVLAGQPYILQEESASGWRPENPSMSINVQPGSCDAVPFPMENFANLESNITLTITDRTDHLSHGRPYRMTWDITVRNGTAQDISDILLVSLPWEHLESQNLDTGGGDFDGGSIVWNPITLAAGQNRMFRVAATVPSNVPNPTQLIASAQLINNGQLALDTTTIGGTVSSSVPSSAAAASSVIIGPPLAGITLEHVPVDGNGDPLPAPLPFPLPGEVVYYRVRVQNVSQQTFRNLTVTYTIPRPQMIFVDDEPKPEREVNRVLTWDIATLGPGEEFFAMTDSPTAQRLRAVEVRVSQDTEHGRRLTTTARVQSQAGSVTRDVAVTVRSPDPFWGCFELSKRLQIYDEQARRDRDMTLEEYLQFDPPPVFNFEIRRTTPPADPMDFRQSVSVTAGQYQEIQLPMGSYTITELPTFGFLTVPPNAQGVTKTVTIEASQKCENVENRKTIFRNKEDLRFPRINIVVTPNPAIAVPGLPLQFRMVVRNDGNADGFDVNIAATFPSVLEGMPAPLINAVAAPTANGVVIPEQFTDGIPTGLPPEQGLWTIDSLPQGRSTNLSLTALVNPLIVGDTITMRFEQFDPTTRESRGFDVVVPVYRERDGGLITPLPACLRMMSVARSLTNPFVTLPITGMSYEIYRIINNTPLLLGRVSGGNNFLTTASPLPPNVPLFIRQIPPANYPFTLIPFTVAPGNPITLPESAACPNMTFINVIVPRGFGVSSSAAQSSRRFIDPLSSRPTSSAFITSLPRPSSQPLIQPFCAQCTSRAPGCNTTFCTTINNRCVPRVPPCPIQVSSARRSSVSRLCFQIQKQVRGMSFGQYPPFTFRITPPGPTYGTPRDIQTNAFGNASVCGLSAVTYRVEEIVPPGFRLAPGEQRIRTINPSANGGRGVLRFINERITTPSSPRGLCIQIQKEVRGMTFGQYPPFTFRVTPPGASFGIPRDIQTNVFGNASICGLSAVTYRVEEIVPAGYRLAAGQQRIRNVRPDTNVMGLGRGVVRFINERVGSSSSSRGLCIQIQKNVVGANFGEYPFFSFRVTPPGASFGQPRTVQTNAFGNATVCGLSAVTYRVEELTPLPPGYRLAPREARIRNVRPDTNVMGLGRGVVRFTNERIGASSAPRLCIQIQKVVTGMAFGEYPLFTFRVTPPGPSFGIPRDVQTNEFGNASICGLSAVTYRVEEIIPAGFRLAPGEARIRNVRPDTNVMGLGRGIVRFTNERIGVGREYLFCDRRLRTPLAVAGAAFMNQCQRFTPPMPVPMRPFTTVMFDTNRMSECNDHCRTDIVRCCMPSISPNESRRGAPACQTVLRSVCVQNRGQTYGFDDTGGSVCDLHCPVPGSMPRASSSSVRSGQKEFLLCDRRVQAVNAVAGAAAGGLNQCRRYTPVGNRQQLPFITVMFDTNRINECTDHCTRAQNYVACCVRGRGQCVFTENSVCRQNRYVTYPIGQDGTSRCDELCQ